MLRPGTSCTVILAKSGHFYFLSTWKSPPVKIRGFFYICTITQMQIKDIKNSRLGLLHVLCALHEMHCTQVAPCMRTQIKQTHLCSYKTLYILPDLRAGSLLIPALGNPRSPHRFQLILIQSSLCLHLSRTNGLPHPHSCPHGSLTQPSPKSILSQAAKLFFPPPSSFHLLALSGGFTPVLSPSAALYFC